jgi:hypothetical protein
MIPTFIDLLLLDHLGLTFRLAILAGLATISRSSHGLQIRKNKIPSGRTASHHVAEAFTHGGVRLTSGPAGDSSNGFDGILWRLRQE